MTTHSPAAKAYAESYPVVFTPETLMVAEAFDAGIASVAPVVAEPITTAAQLDALPLLSAVLDYYGDVWQKCEDGWVLVEGVARGVGVVVRDGAPLTLLTPASPPTPAPVLLTADDPRIKDGALVDIRQEYGGEGEANAYTRRIGPRFGWHALAIRERIKDGHTVTLLAEAPDPDADVRRALIAAIGSTSLADGYDPLTQLRGIGYDVVKRADS